jgi:hypothetical protein
MHRSTRLLQQTAPLVRPPYKGMPKRAPAPLTRIKHSPAADRRLLLVLHRHHTTPSITEAVAPANHRDDLFLFDKKTGTKLAHCALWGPMNINLAELFYLAVAAAGCLGLIAAGFLVAL